MQASASLFRYVVSGLLVLMAGCSESPPDSATTERPGFTGRVSDSLKEEITGPGVASYLPAREMVAGGRPGYFLISNIVPDITTTNQVKVKVKFRIPEGTQSGTYNLVSPGSTGIGKDFEVRVDAMVGGTMVSYHANTDGTISLDQFPSNPNNLSGAIIKGRFQFVSENQDGEKASVQGSFDFLGGLPEF